MVNSSLDVTVCSLLEAIAAIDVGLKFDLDTARAEVPLKSSTATSSIWRLKPLAGRIIAVTNQPCEHGSIWNVPKLWTRALVHVGARETIGKHIHASCSAQGR